MVKKPSLLIRVVRKVLTYYFLSRIKCWGGGGWVSLAAEISNPKRVMIGKNPVIHSRVWLVVIDGPTGPGLISIGNDVHISRDAIIASAFDITIGNGVTIGPRASIYDNNHNFDDMRLSVMRQGLNGDPVSIGDYAWIGAHAVILPGVSIGKGAVVGAGAVVTKSVPDYAITVGNPAKIIRYR